MDWKKALFSRLRAFKAATRGDVTPKETIGMLISAMFAAAILPQIVTTIQEVNTTTWTFTGATGAKLLFLLIPFICTAAIALSYVYKAFGKK